MRPFEWFLLLSFLPILLLPFVSQTWRRRWLAVSAPLPTVVALLHLALEGWRVQMLTLYGLALLILALRAPELLGRARTVRRRLGWVVNGVGALAVVGSGVLAGWLLPVVNLPDPTGPYAVGIVDREVVDSARARRLMASIWYPAAHAGEAAPLTHHPDAVTTAMGNLAGLPGVLFQQMRYFLLDASEDVPVLEDGAPFPVLVFSHGMVGMRLQSSPMMQELASWGYVVVALDHTDAAAVTVFPDGEARFYDLAKFDIAAADGEPSVDLMDERVFPVWVADQQAVYDAVEGWAIDDPLLARKLDVARIGSFGHSFGGATSLEVCRVEARCRAAVNLDGGLYGALVEQPAVAPLLLITSAESHELAYAVEKWQAMMARAEDTAYWLEIPGSTHLSFTIIQLLSPILVPAGFDVREGLRVTDEYVRAFFDLHLRGEETLPLGATGEASNVRWHSEPMR